MDHFYLAFLLLPLLASSHGVNGMVVQSCQAISIPLCQDMVYNETIMPTMMGHKTQEESELDMRQFYPFIKEGCSPDLKHLICFLYAPVCTIFVNALPPCRPLCESAKSGCEDLMNKTNFVWPESLQCEQFPLRYAFSSPCVDKVREETITGSPRVIRPAPAEPQTVAPNRSEPPGAKQETEDSELQNKAP